jgi:hypothetical protein
MHADILGCINTDSDLVGFNAEDVDYNVVADDE